MRTEQIQVLPLYGYGNFGSNCTIIGTANESFILDLGMSFEEKGENYYENIKRNAKQRLLQPSFILLTHAHADHISFILDSAFMKLNLPIYCSAFSRDFIEKRTKKLNLIVLEQLQEVIIGEFSIIPILVEHSCDGTFAFEVATKEGTRITIIPDHKLETASILEKFTKKPDLLFIESTNSTEPIRIDSEKVVVEKIENIYDLYSKMANHVYISTFSLCTKRILKVVDLAIRENKKLLVLGKSIQYSLKILLENKLVHYDKIFFVKRAANIVEQVRKEDKLIILCSGHQGEPNAALPLLIDAEVVNSNDLILFLSKQIPEPDAIINRNLLLAKIQKLKIPFVDNIHCSGHSAMPELTYTLKQIAANMIIPMHGDAKNLGGMLDIINKNKIPSRLRIIVNNQYVKFKINLSKREVKL